MSELLSICCTSEPLYEIHEVEGADPIGLCGNCREHTTFEAEIEESVAISCNKCKKEAKVTLEDIPYCVKCYKSVNKIGENYE